MDILDYAAGVTGQTFEVRREGKSITISEISPHLKKQRYFFFIFQVMTVETDLIGKSGT